MLQKPTLLAALTLAACAPNNGVADGGALRLASFDQEESSTQYLGSDYRIGATDQLNITVFQVEDLTFEKLPVDASGMLQLPLIGQVRAAGNTPSELGAEIARRLSERYMQNPQVSVTVAEAASQKITVDGAVTKPGVYVMRGRTTLLQAIAMAEGPTRVASLQNVAVFRTVEGRRMAALFDLQRIRAGELADPYLEGDDVVIVDTSRLNASIREILSALPGLAVFGYL